MGINLNLSPHDLFNTRSNRAQERQLNLDNEFRREQADLAEEWRQREWDFKDKRIQSLVSDARRAGVSPLAALGVSGTQAPSFNIPVGQGGRVQGRDRSTVSYTPSTADKLSKAQIHLDMLDRQYQSIMNRNAAISSGIDLEIKQKQLSDIMSGASDIPKVYKKGFQNVDEAIQMIQQGYFPYLNPEMNFELMESVGTYLFSKPFIGSGVQNIPSGN